jgi:hypothetical protein
MNGKALLKELISATGLPSESLAKEIENLLQKDGLPEDACALEDLRKLLAEYAQEILVEAKRNY